MNTINRYCEKCGGYTEHSFPSGSCVSCEQRAQGEAETSILGCSVIATLIFMAVCAVAFLAINAVALAGALIIQPWGLAGSLLLVRWLWRNDGLAAEPKPVRYGVAGFLTIFGGLYIIAFVRTVFALQLITLAKELFFFTLPGVAAGWVFSMLSERFRGRLWPVFIDICLAHTLGKATILGWIAASF